jgi:PleD family two-component response regulator
MESLNVATSNTIGVLVADSNQMQCQLLVSALRRRTEFRVHSCGVDMNVILNAISGFPVDVILMNADHPKLAGQDMANVRRLHLAHPHIAKVLVLGESNRDTVVNAFRSGVKGLSAFPTTRSGCCASASRVSIRDKCGRIVSNCSTWSKP